MVRGRSSAIYRSTPETFHGTRPVSCLELFYPPFAIWSRAKVLIVLSSLRLWIRSVEYTGVRVAKSYPWTSDIFVLIIWTSQQVTQQTRTLSWLFFLGPNIRVTNAINDNFRAQEKTRRHPIFGDISFHGYGGIDIDLG